MGKWIHFFRGYLRIRVSGYSVQRFMNLCSNQNILLWNIENHGSYDTMYISIKGFLSLRPILRKTKTRAVIQKRYGLPFFMPGIYKRCIFLFGLCGCLLFLHIMSGYIWAIEIVGNVRLTDELFLDFLKTEKIQCGIPKKELDIEALEKDIRREFDQITWTSARLEGTRLFIQVKENDRIVEDPEAPGLYEDTPADLVADKDGIVVDMITRSGVPLVSGGDEIKEGDVLVSGSIPIFGEDALPKGFLYCRADADVYLRRQRQIREKLPAAYVRKQYSGKQLRIPYVRLFSREWKAPFFRNRFLKSDCVCTEHVLEPLQNVVLPVSYGTYQYREYELVRKKYTESQIRELCQNKMQKIMESFREKGVQILQKDVKIEKDMSHYVLKADFTVIEKVGVMAAASGKLAGELPDGQIAEE